MGRFLTDDELNALAQDLEALSFEPWASLAHPDPNPAVPHHYETVKDHPELARVSA